MWIPNWLITGVFFPVASGLLLAALVGLWQMQGTVTQLQERILSLEGNEVSAIAVNQVLNDQRAEIDELRMLSMASEPTLHSNKALVEIHATELQALREHHSAVSETLANIRERIAKLEATSGNQ